MRISSVGVALLIAVMSVGTVTAQTYPHKPVTLIVPFPSGGPSDTVARTIAVSMQKRLHRDVVIENVGGAGGIVGSQRVARAAPDGYTLLLHHSSMAVARAVQPQLDFDPLQDFEFIGQIGHAPMTLIGRRDLPAKSLAELLKYLKANAGSITFAHAGRGSGSFLCGLLLMEAADASLKAVRYKGTGPAMNDLLTGKLDLMCEQATTATPHIRRADVMAFGIASSERVSSSPELLTLHEQGLEGFAVEIWYALYAPKGTPAEALQKLNQALRFALADPLVNARFTGLGTELVPLDKVTSGHARRHLENEIRKWVPIVEKARAYVD